MGARLAELTADGRADVYVIPDIQSRAVGSLCCDHFDSAEEGNNQQRESASHSDDHRSSSSSSSPVMAFFIWAFRRGLIIAENIRGRV